MRVDYSMFEGFRVKGNARTVMSRGEVMVDQGQFRVPEASLAWRGVDVKFVPKLARDRGFGHYA